MNFTGVVILVLIAVVVGFAAGAMLMLLMKDREPKSADTSETDSRTGLYREIARLWRDRQNGRLVLEVNGKMVASRQALNEAELRIAQEALAAWQDWMGESASISRGEVPNPPKGTGPLAAPAPVSPVVTAPVVEPQAGGQSIVAQIDAILQEMLAGTALEARKIRLAEEPRHGVVVWVGAQRFESIEAVPEAAIQAVIRGAVAKWEHRNTNL